MKFYIKYSRLPHVYTVVSSSNGKSALAKAKEYRNDAILINGKDKVFTFEDGINFSHYWDHYTLEQVEEKITYEVYDCNKDVKPGSGILVIEETKTIESLNPQKLLEFCKERSKCRNGVIWAKDSTGTSLVFGDKKDQKTRPLIVLTKIVLEKLT